MNANDAFAAAQEIQSRHEEAAARTASLESDPEARRIIAEAEAANRRQQERIVMPESELLSLFGLAALDDEANRVITLAQSVGFPGITRTVRRGMLGKERPSIAALRHDVERWLATFDELAAARGYRRSAKK